MRGGLATGLVLCLAVLLGFAPPRVLAADPPASGAASTAPATPSAGQQGASAGPDTSAETAPRAASAPKNSAGPDASGGHSPSDPQHGMPRSPGKRELAARPPLDLSPPPMNHVMTPEQMQALIGVPDDAEPDEVMVEQGRYEEPVPQGQIPALAWALLHPLQAWRIFTPVTDQ